MCQYRALVILGDKCNKLEDMRNVVNIALSEAKNLWKTGDHLKVVEIVPSHAFAGYVVVVKRDVQSKGCLKPGM